MNVPCPNCQAPGEIHPYFSTLRIAEGAMGSEFGTALCHTCGGTHEITEEYADAIRKGKILRDNRVNADKSLREAAAVIGCSPVDLSHIEHGRITDENRELAERLWAEVEEA